MRFSALAESKPSFLQSIVPPCNWLYLKRNSIFSGLQSIAQPLQLIVVECFSNFCFCFKFYHMKPFSFLLGQKVTKPCSPHVILSYLVPIPSSQTCALLSLFFLPKFNSLLPTHISNTFTGIPHKIPLFLTSTHSYFLYNIQLFYIKNSNISLHKNQAFLCNTYSTFIKYSKLKPS